MTAVYSGETLGPDQFRLRNMHLARQRITRLREDRQMARQKRDFARAAVLGSMIAQLRHNFHETYGERA